MVVIFQFYSGFTNVLSATPLYIKSKHTSCHDWYISVICTHTF
jgi:hypothetical protein